MKQGHHHHHTTHSRLALHTYGDRPVKGRFKVHPANPIRPFSRDRIEIENQRAARCTGNSPSCIRSMIEPGVVHSTPPSPIHRPGLRSTDPEICFDSRSSSWVDHPTVPGLPSRLSSVTESLLSPSSNPIDHPDHSTSATLPNPSLQPKPPRTTARHHKLQSTPHTYNKYTYRYLSQKTPTQHLISYHHFVSDQAHPPIVVVTKGIIVNILKPFPVQADTPSLPSSFQSVNRLTRRRSRTTTALEPVKESHPPQQHGTKLGRDLVTQSEQSS
ncbi:hypothetical protein PGT21_005069 [Puccinia graminis f. sp. tritici]|uniref:Uncharacterized protein n=1 Tax=Puccinia graminis f. sp. tritici TaxID=56615 RepID=A0A5B0P7X3_PUCGR|nr:hypothetical protein PGT21_005069 [Puccinia graminis f. sp. tritici]KAA1118359.1 hypothetical protein PGTUg99_006099 [Puccinia graminis f. sp. tritici]